MNFAKFANRVFLWVETEIELLSLMTYKESNVDKTIVVFTCYLYVVRRTANSHCADVCGQALISGLQARAPGSGQLPADSTSLPLPTSARADARLPRQLGQNPNLEIVKLMNFLVE